MLKSAQLWVLLFAQALLVPSLVAAEDAPEQASQFDLDVADSLSARRGASPQASAFILTSAEIQELIDGSWLDLGSYLATVPGFDVAPLAWRNWPGARGVSGAVNFMIDGVPLTSPLDYRFASGWGLFIEEFDKLEVITGPAGVAWGAFSLLGNVNLLSGRVIRDRASYSYTLGADSLQRATARYQTNINGHELKLFVGAASARGQARRPRAQVTGTPPYSDGWRIGTNLSSTDPATDAYATVSVHYQTPYLTAYLRLPYAKQHYQVSELGSVLDKNDQGSVESVDALGFVALHRTIAEGRAAFLVRAAWYRLVEEFDRQLFSPSAAVPIGARSLAMYDISRFSFVGEGTYRYRSGLLQSDLMLGVEALAERPHDSEFFITSSAYPGGLVSQGPALEQRTQLTESVYVFDETRLLERLSLAGGARFNAGNGAYRDTWLYQSNIAARLVGQTYLKFGYTQGMRPPQLLDRQGIRPVKGSSNLKPETSSSLQFELNTALEAFGPIESFFARADYAVTTTKNEIVREQKLFSYYDERPINRKGGNLITSIDGMLKVRLTPFGTELYATYRRNARVDSRTTLATENIAVGALCTGADGKPRECANAGPKERLLIRAGAKAGDLVFGYGQIERECGGYIASLPDDLTVVQKPELVFSERPCTFFGSVGMRYPATPTSFSVNVALNNFTDQRPRLGSYSLSELSGAEPSNAVGLGRTFFASLRWHTEQETSD